MDNADRLLNIYNEGTQLKCKDCPVICQYRKLQLDKDEDALCLFPERRKNAEINGEQIKLLDEILVGAATQEIVELLLNEFRKNKDSEFGIKVLKCLIDLKKNYWPATQKSLTGSIKDFSEQLRLWKIAQIEARKEVEKKSEKEVEEEVEKEIQDIEDSEDEDFEQVGIVASSKSIY